MVVKELVVSEELYEVTQDMEEYERQNICDALQYGIDKCELTEREVAKIGCAEAMKYVYEYYNSVKIPLELNKDVTYIILKATNK